MVFNYDECLTRLGGDRELFDEILEFFLEDAPVLLETVRSSLEANDAAQAERAAHSLKGLAANFTADAAAAAALAVELNVRERNMRGAAACLGELELQLERLEQALREFRDRSTE